MRCSRRPTGVPSRKIVIEVVAATGQFAAVAFGKGVSMLRFWAAFLLMLFGVQVGLLAQTPVTTWHYNNGRTGANTAETLLTPSNVKVQTFGKLFSQPVDGIIVGHPLYLPNVNIPGQGLHNVVYVATLHNTVYAFDADTAAAPLWVTSLLDQSPAGAIPTPAVLKKNINPTAWSEMGVISTPVIDAATGTMYLVAETFENASVAHRLHALDITTGQEKLGGPATIAGTSIQNGVATTFQDFYQINRPGLLLVNGHIYIAWGSNGNNALPCQGWVFSYNAATLQQEGVFTTEPGQSLGSIWQEGAGLSADSDGNIYAENGEGPYVAGTNLSTSVLKLSQVGTALSLSDWYTPINHMFLSAQDLDLTGGVVILPDQPGPFAHEAIAIGKQGIIYVVNRDNMGQLCSTCTTTDTQIVQEVPAAAVESGTPVYWNNTLYFTGLGLPILAFPMTFGSLGAPISAPTVRGAGANAILTANGNTNGILWLLDGNHDLWALDAGSLTMLWVSGQAPNGRDALPPLAHFATPIAADGKVFVGTTNSLFVYGLFPSLSATGGGGQSSFVSSILPIPLAVKAADPYSQGVVTGLTVTFSDGGKGGNFNPASAVTDSNGFASTSYTLPAKAGSYTVTASAAGYASGLFSETAVARGGTATTTTLHSGSNPSTVGQAVTFTATITSTGGSVPDGETVTFKSGTTVLGAGTLAAGAATFTISTLPAGVDPITAAYAGDTTFAPSSGVVSQVVKSTTTTTLSSSLNPSPIGQAVTFTANVTSTGGSIPDGEIVTFKSGATVLGTSALSSGTATFTTSTLPGGTDSITAAYPGDTAYRSSYATISQKVGKNTTTTVLHSASNPSTVGQSVTFTATVTSAAGSIPDGETVTFKTGSTVLGTGTLTSGAATFTISTLPAGVDPITAAYTGDATFATSSGAVSQVVKSTTTTTVSSSLNPSNVGQAVTFTATVSSAGGSTPDGEMVTFKNGTTVLGTGVLTSGTATFTTSALPGGTDSITAAYPGDTANRSSYNTISQRVTKNSTTASLSSNLNPSTAGQPVTFTATIASTAGSIPDGEMVTFKTGTTVLGTATLTGGAASFSISTLPAGTDPIAASYAGDTNFAASSAAVSQVVR